MFAFIGMILVIKRLNKLYVQLEEWRERFPGLFIMKPWRGNRYAAVPISVLFKDKKEAAQKCVFHLTTAG